MRIHRILYLPPSSVFRSLKTSQVKTRPYPEVNFEVAASAKFAVADLEGDSHLVVRMEEFVKAFARMCLELDVVGDARTQQCRNGNEYSKDHIWLELSAVVVCVRKCHLDAFPGPLPNSPLEGGGPGIGPQKSTKPFFRRSPRH